MSVDLQDEIDHGFLRTERIVQRIGWAAILAVLVAAIAGLFGGGFFSNATARHRGEGYELALTYPRFARAESNLEMELVIEAPEVQAPEVTTVLSGELLDKASITGITPEPDSESVRGDSIAYTWQIEDWSQPLVVRFEYESRDWRMVGGRFDVTAGDQSLGELSFKQFLFP